MRRGTVKISSLVTGLILMVGATFMAHAAFPVKYHPGHYMLTYFELKNPTNAFKLIQNESAFIGVQRRYTWKSLEPQRGVYDFSSIAADLNFLKSLPTPKRLIIQITITGRDSFGNPHIPNYLKTPEFDGGFYTSARGNTVTKRWNTAVQNRLIALHNALGARFDNEPYFEGVALEETATGIRPIEWTRANYTSEKMYAGLKRIMLGLKTAFPRSVCIQYVNYFSGANAQDGTAKIAGLIQYAYEIGMGAGGPDVHVGGTEPSYKMFPKYAANMPIGIAVQYEDYDVINPATGRKVTAQEILNFAKNKLHVNYLFWLQRAPQFGTDVVPTVRRSGGL